MNLWHDVSAGPNLPDVVHAVIEIPKGSRNKYEYSKTEGMLKLDRVLYSAIHYPGDYGFVPQSYFDDDDPLDILVMVNLPTFPGCLIEARPIGMFKMRDRGEPDYKILAVPVHDPHFKDFHALADVPKHYLVEVEHFFTTYKQLEGVKVEQLGWADVAEAKETLDYSIKKYQEAFSK